MLQTRMSAGVAMWYRGGGGVENVGGEDEKGQEEEEGSAQDVREDVDGFIVEVAPGRDAVCDAGCGAAVARVNELAAVLLPFLWGCA